MLYIVMTLVGIMRLLAIIFTAGEGSDTMLNN